MWGRGQPEGEGNFLPVEIVHVEDFLERVRGIGTDVGLVSVYGTLMHEGVCVYKPFQLKMEDNVIRTGFWEMS